MGSVGGSTFRFCRIWPGAGLTSSHQKFFVRPWFRSPSSLGCLKSGCQTTIATDCLEMLVSEMICHVARATLNSFHSTTDTGSYLQRRKCRMTVSVIVGMKYSVDSLTIWLWRSEVISVINKSPAVVFISNSPVTSPRFVYRSRSLHNGIARKAPFAVGAGGGATDRKQSIFETDIVGQGRGLTNSRRAGLSSWPAVCRTRRVWSAPATAGIWCDTICKYLNKTINYSLPLVVSSVVW